MACGYPAAVRDQITGQFANKQAPGQSTDRELVCRGLINSWTSHLAERFDGKV